MCNRTCCSGHRHILDRIRTGGYSCSYTNRRSRSNDNGCNRRDALGQKNFFRSEEHNAKRNLRSKRRRNCKNDSVCIKGHFIIEFAGALAMSPVFISDYGLRGIWMSIFHSISAFCNAGFDLMGKPDSKFSSVTAYSANPLINIVLMLLIIVGGIGFLTWKDVVEHKFRLRRYRLQSKIVLVTSGVLILIPAVLFSLTISLTIRWAKGF